RIKAFDRIKADVLDPVSEFGAEVLALDGVAGDALLAPAGKRTDKLALEIHTLQRVAIIPGLKALRHGLDTMPRFRAVGCIGQNTLGVKPPGLDPGRSAPAIDRSRRRGHQLRRADLLDCGIPIRPRRPPLRANETRQHA